MIRPLGVGGPAGRGVAIGTLWTLFLLAIYLPAAMILRGRSGEEADRALLEAGEKERHRSFAEHGFDLSPVQRLKRLFGVFGPVLSGLLLTRLKGLRR